ncbi:MAG TPA: TIGR03435 family protein [Bryobacteraceae bacterium]
MIAKWLGFAKNVILVAIGAAVVATPIVVGIIDPPVIHAQSAAAARVRFEVASIKRSTDCGDRDNIYGAPLSGSPGTLTLNCATVAGLILGAYSRYANGRTSFSLPLPILGGPSWINSERYTINAKSAGQENRAITNGPMLQALLEDRFKLKLHRETRQVPVFALTATKSGARLKTFREGTCSPVDYAQNPPPLAPGQPPFCQNRIQSKGANLRTYHEPGATVATFSELLSVILGRPVIDKTGIKGRFDFDLEFAIDQSTPGFVSDTPDTDPRAGASIFTAVQEQLGLMLKPAKGAGEFLVIDYVERPSEN